MDGFPEGFVGLFEEHRLGIQSSLDHLAFLLHAWMLELGFRLDTEQAQSLDLSAKKRRSTSSATVASGIKFHYFVLNDDATGNRRRADVLLQLIPIAGQIVLVKAVFSGLRDDDNNEGSAAVAFPLAGGSLDLSDHVVGNVEAPPPPPPPAERYSKVRELGQRFKDSVGWPLMRHVRDLLGIPPGTDQISCLPLEVASLVAAQIDQPLDLLNFGATCTSFQDISNRNIYWKRFFRRDFAREYDAKSEEEKQDADTDWKSNYKEQRQRVRMLQGIRTSGIRSTGWPRSPPPPQPPPRPRGGGGPPRGGGGGAPIPPRFRPRYDPPHPDFL